MADDDYYMKKVKDLSYELDNVSEAFIDISRLQKGVIKGFTEITKTSTATGQAWVSVARFFSGSGFWRVQNRIKAVSNALQFMQKIEEDRNKAEQDRMKELAKNEQHMKNLANLHEKLEKIQNQALRIILNKPRWTRITDMYDEAKICSITDRLKSLAKNWFIKAKTTCHHPINHTTYINRINPKNLTLYEQLLTF